MLNSVATLWVAFLVNGPWEDPDAKISLPFSAVFVPAAQLPTLGNTRVHLGLAIGLVTAVLLAFVLTRTRWGYEIRAIGHSVTAARFAGMRVTRNILAVMFLSGGLAGIAGMTEVSGVILRLQDQISPGYGFTAIIVAALARTNPIGVVVVSFLFGMLLVSGFAIQSIGVSASLSTIIQGVILLAVLCSEFFLNYKMRLIRPGSGKKGAEIKGVV
jgi:general nucleoside transport system permease protein